jgi:hypothetical protein
MLFEGVVYGTQADRSDKLIELAVDVFLAKIKDTPCRQAFQVRCYLGQCNRVVS